MIRFILLQNRQGKTRLAKYYIPLEESEKHKVEFEVHRLVVNRDPKFTNFVEFRTHKVIYRRYAGLFFSLCVDITDNELAYLESIHLFVEILDHFFSNVCELDLVFNFHKVYLILDEFILAGELQETSKRVCGYRVCNCLLIVSYYFDFNSPIVCKGEQNVYPMSVSKVGKAFDCKIPILESSGLCFV
ncbi:AP-2 complex subunit sigma isoform X1 [Rhododendron vialii]|uniref:AP-2 complex subunit sigma isoform X1 n=1 Tax=Rhododendron vialii TaxID=182163 RepID=UPI00265E3E15|nr:AP-2 complex subunit sigma isoform X1 [Rhododendron vialii]